jgi:MraZ protein
LGDDRLIITTNFDGNLVAYTQLEWQNLENRLNKLPQLNPHVIRFKRFFISGATECPIDKTGRVLIPPVLREHAQIEKEIIFAGMITHIEIWARERWEKEYEVARVGMDDTIKALAELGF